MTLTSRDIARLAGVSQATVSRVLTGHPNVRASTKSRVEEIVARERYVPNAPAQAMRTNKSDIVGVVVSDIANPFYAAMARKIGGQLQQYGLKMVLWDAADGPGEQAALEAIQQRLLTGLIFTSATPGSRPLTQALERKVPIVLLNRSVRNAFCNQVESDNLRAAALAARYFIHHGHTNVGIISVNSSASTARDRRTGFMRAARKPAGITLREVKADFTHAGGRRGMTQLLNTASPPTAVYCVTDLIALGAIDAARSMNVGVPSDVWVVGHDDIEMASWESYGLTTLRQDMDEAVTRGLEFLLRQIKGDPSVDHLKLANRLVVRASTAHAVAPDDEPKSSVRGRPSSGRLDDHTV